eukprot:403336879
MGLKKAAAARKNTKNTKKKDKHQIHSQLSNYSQVMAENSNKNMMNHSNMSIEEPNIMNTNSGGMQQPLDQNQFGTRSSSVGRINSQQPRQGGQQSSRANKQRKSAHLSSREDNTNQTAQLLEQNANEFQDSYENKQIVNQSNGFNQTASNNIEMKRSKARIKELQKHVDVSGGVSTSHNIINPNQLYQNLNSNQMMLVNTNMSTQMNFANNNFHSAKKPQVPGSLSRQQTFNQEEVIIARSNLGTSQQRKRQQQQQDSSVQSRKSQNFQVYDSFNAVNTSKGSQNIAGQFFKGKLGGTRKSQSTGRSGLSTKHQLNASQNKRQIQEVNNHIMGLVQQQTNRYNSQINNFRNTESQINPMINQQSLYQPNPNSVPQRKQQDLYKVYLNYVPNQAVYNAQQDQSLVQQQKMQTPNGIALAPNLQQDLIMVNRHNNLVQKNRKILSKGQNSNSNHHTLSNNGNNNINILNQANNSALLGGIQELPLINSHNNTTALVKQFSGDQQSQSPSNTQNYNNPYGSNKNSIQKQGNKTQGTQQQMSIYNHSNGSKMSTMGGAANTYYKLNGMAATTQVHNNFHTSSLEQYNQHQFASINQSMLMRNLNMSILNGELENETSLEDMHMFFVAFNKRQKRIVCGVEDDLLGEHENTRMLNDQAQEVMIVDGEQQQPQLQIPPPVTVVQLEEEIDLE